MSIGDRVRRARKKAGLTQTQLGKAVGLTQATISDLEKGESRSSAYLLEISKACDVDPEWLSNGSGEMGSWSHRPKHVREADAASNDHELEFFGGLEPWDDNTPLGPDEVELPLFREVELAAGSGQTQVIENHGPKLRFARSTLRRAGVEPDNAACAYVNGDSMEPALPDGTTVGMDKADRHVKDGKVYVIDHDGLLRVKLLYRLPGGGLRVRSFNRDEYPDEDYGADWPEFIEIKGKMFWSSTMWL